MALQSAFTLTSNEIFETLANMIISQQVFADNLGSHQTLVDKGRVDGGKYGDTKLYYATDCLQSYPFGADATHPKGGVMDLEAPNLLQVFRPADPEVQAIKLDVFRQIRVSVDQYISPRAFATEGAFLEFNGVVLSWLRETKRIYDGTTYACYIGTTEATGAGQNRTITVNEGGNSTGENIARGIADLLSEMADYSREFNDYGFMRSYAKEDIKIVWNVKYINAIKRIDLPSIFHNEKLESLFAGDELQAKYFGEVNENAKVADGTATRALEEITIGTSHYFPGELIKSGETAPAGKSYQETEDVICKVLVKYPPYMSGFEVGSTFINARAANLETHFLTWSHNTLQYFKNYPFITVKAVTQE